MGEFAYFLLVFQRLLTLRLDLFIHVLESVLQGGVVMLKFL
jgi:hypothetical protein